MHCTLKAARRHTSRYETYNSPAYKFNTTATFFAFGDHDTDILVTVGIYQHFWPYFYCT